MMFTDHLVFMVQDLQRTEVFYTAIFGKPPLRVGNQSVVYDIDGTKIFFGLPYDTNQPSYNRNAHGLNHLAIGLEEGTELEAAEKRLTEAGIKHSPIIPCTHTDIPMIWLDDPDGMRVEFYLRGKNRDLV